MSCSQLQGKRGRFCIMDGVSCLQVVFAWAGGLQGRGGHGQHQQPPCGPGLQPGGPLATPAPHQCPSRPWRLQACPPCNSFMQVVPLSLALQASTGCLCLLLCHACCCGVASTHADSCKPQTASHGDDHFTSITAMISANY